MLAFLGDLCDEKNKKSFDVSKCPWISGEKTSQTHTLVSPHQTTSSCIHPGKLTARSWTSPVWKGTSSEPNLHFFRLHVKFRGCSSSFHSFPYLLYSCLAWKLFGVPLGNWSNVAEAAGPNHSLDIQNPPVKHLQICCFGTFFWGGPMFVVHFYCLKRYWKHDM